MTFELGQVLSILAAVGSALGIYQVYHWVRAFRQRAQVVLGILPHNDVNYEPVSAEQIGRRESSLEFIFGVGTREWFARPMRQNKIFRHLAQEPYHDAIRHYMKDDDNTYVLPIILANNGRAAFGRYRLTIRVNADLSCDSTVKIIDVVTEDADIASVYADIKEFEQGKTRERVTDSRIYVLPPLRRVAMPRPPRLVAPGGTVQRVRLPDDPRGVPATPPLAGRTGPGRPSRLTPVPGPVLHSVPHSIRGPRSPR